MTTTSLQALLDGLIQERDSAFLDGTPNVSVIQDIILRIKRMSPPQRSFFKDFFLDLKNRVFDAGANITGLDLSLFGEPEDIQETTSLLDAEVVLANKSYIETLSEISDCLKDELPTLKNYFFLRLHSQNNNNYTPLIIYEAGCFYQHLKKKIETKYGSCKCKSIEEMRQDIEKGTFDDLSYVALLIVSTKINEKDKVENRENDLSIIISHYEEVYHLSPKKSGQVNSSDVISTNNIEAFLEEIKYVTSTFLTNAELSNDEEKVIKKLFQDSGCPILEYKVLKGGKSGSKVIEVRLVKNYGNSFAKRYIVKFCTIDGKGKIAIENKRFGDHIEPYSILGYQKQYAKNTRAEAMQYTYASSNSIINSYSFSEIINDTGNKFHSEASKIIDEVFSSKPFELWKQSIEDGKYKVSELYKDYIKPEKFFQQIAKIKGINSADIEKEDIVSNFRNIFETEISTKNKVCHGDFHSENFFKDANGTYLIDFGFTDSRHAIIDHTSLECSIKFKHVPFYIEASILEEIETQLILEESFNASFELKTIRKDITIYYDLIRLIRLNALTLLKDSNSKLEYLLSLYVMTCRQVQYADLNQLYALKSAEILGKRLVQLLP